MLGGNSKLEFIVEKSLLELIEKQGLPREQIVLVDICDSSKDIFGEPGSAVRRDIQEHWGNLKRRSIRSYINYLGRFDVEPNAVTKLIYERTATVPSDDSDSGDDTTPTTTATPVAKSTNNARPSSSLAKHPSSAAKKAEFELADSFGKLSFQSPQRTFVSPNLRPPTFSPPYRGIMSISTPATDLSDGSFRGSRANPVDVDVNHHFPERNNIFDIQFVPRIEHNGWARQGYHIRTAIGIEDDKHWSARMDPAEETRSILICGRSRPQIMI